MKKRFLAIIPATVLATGLILLAGASCTSSTTTTTTTTNTTATTTASTQSMVIGNDGGLATLRGAPVSAQDNTVTGEGLKVALETAPLERNFADQPPVVSHPVDDYPITKSTNKCMDCHSRENYKKEKATQISKTHYEAANGKILSSVSSRRHFCVQCHIPQVDAKPLVTNTFQPAK